jgi:hypothetical protein
MIVYSDYGSSGLWSFYLISGDLLPSLSEQSHHKLVKNIEYNYFKNEIIMNIKNKCLECFKNKFSIVSKPFKINSGTPRKRCAGYMEIQVAQWGCCKEF